jgi:tripartite-type tricarboxylate transporter receptor subunit TctC
VRDLAPVAIVASAPVFLVVRESFPAKTVQEFVAYAKGNPGKISFGIQGVGTDLHAMLELLRERADVKITAVPYSGGAPAIVDLLAERLDAMFLVPAVIKEHLVTGRLRALATLEPKRVPSFPSIPTTTESSLPEVTTKSWFGFTAPAATPKPIIAKLAAAFTKTQEDKVLVSKLDAMGYELRVVEAAEAEHVFANERTKYSKIAAGGRLDRVN